MFESVGFLVTAPIILLGCCYYLRVDNKLSEWKAELDQELR